MPAHDLYLISDSAGNLLEHFFSAVLTQFPKELLSIHQRTFVKDEASLLKVLQEIKEGVVFHAIASLDLKATVQRECAKRDLACWDVTGPTVEFLERVTTVKASRIPKPFHPFDRHYQNRIEALEFAMQHDDNQRIEDIEKAEIILVGISRVSKSPTSVFLAYRGFRVANVSWDPRQGLPGPVISHKRKNVVALTIRPAKLAQIRQRRFSKWDLPDFDYSDLSSIVLEVMESERIYKKKGWPVIDITDLTVEETSSLVLSELALRSKTFSLKGEKYEKANT